MAQVACCLETIVISNQGFVLPGNLTIRREGRSFGDLPDQGAHPVPINHDACRQPVLPPHDRTCEEESMATARGFVDRIEVRRAGLVPCDRRRRRVASTYVISDLDADPERFNERLSKVAVLRDAMNRAEPVEIEHTEGDAGEEIDRAARISRTSSTPRVRSSRSLGSSCRWPWTRGTP